MSASRLTVGIPTYNRAKVLREALDSVLAQSEERFRDRLEILVSDNASTDDTRLVVQDYAARYPGVVSYCCNASNLGYSRNVDAVIRQARGEFVFLLSDDDSLDDRALATLFGILDRHEDLVAVFLFPTPYDPDLRIPLAVNPSPADTKPDDLYRPGLEYLRRTRAFPPALVSGYVVRREAWIQANPAEYYDTLIVHTLTALRMLVCQPNFSVCVSHVPCIRYRTEGFGSTCAAAELYPFVFHLELLVGCNSVKAMCPPDVRRYLHQQAMRSIAYHCMDLKVKGGRINVPLLTARMRELADRGDPLYWLNRLLLLLPGWTLRIPFRLAVRAFDAMRGKARCAS